MGIKDKTWIRKGPTFFVQTFPPLPDVRGGKVISSTENRQANAARHRAQP